MSRTEHHTPKYNNDGNGKFNLSYHLEMVGDSERVGRVKQAIDYYIKPDSVFCELGCGTGIFSIYAAKKCKIVYAVEWDKKILEVAKRNTAQSGVEGKIDFIHADATKVTLPEKVDIVFCEMMSIWLINEPQVLAMNNAIDKLLRSNGAVIPRKVINLVELGNVDYRFDDVEMRASIAEFSGIRPPRIATESKVVNIVNLQEKNELKISTSVNMISLVSGNLNCVRLSSIVEFAPEIHFYSTDTLMPVTIVPLKDDIMVKEGETIILDIEYSCRTSVDDSVFKIRKT
ncbi:MAG: methyltransferase domain-containing protein [Candidatus Hatepunaea meridiana]|nr:methyltransferase domain-containing protein [Candidatus Hatepunaea meridiana]